MERIRFSTYVLDSILGINCPVWGEHIEDFSPSVPLFTSSDIIPYYTQVIALCENAVTNSLRNRNNPVSYGINYCNPSRGRKDSQPPFIHPISRGNLFLHRLGSSIVWNNLFMRAAHKQPQNRLTWPLSWSRKVFTSPNAVWQHSHPRTARLPAGSVSSRAVLSTELAGPRNHSRLHCRSRASLSSCQAVTPGRCKARQRFQTRVPRANEEV